jgi:DNA polymerase-4
VELHHHIIDTVEDVIPVDRVCSIDEVACRLRGPDAHEAAARAIGHRIQSMILQRVGLTLTASVGVGPSRLLAKTAADMKKPLGLTVLRADTLPGALLDLDIEDFAGIGRAMGGRLRAAGIETVAQLWDLSPSRMRQIWGGVMGENFCYALHGVDPPELETTRGSISHSHVLAKELRPLEQARRVARRLTAKCGSRLRRMGYRCVHLHISLRGDPIGRVQADMRLAATADTFKLLEVMEMLWAQCLVRLNAVKLRKISVNCAKIIPADTPPDLFGWTPDTDEDARHMALWHALDGLNQRFGKDMITVGPRPKIHAFVGAKIAFNRVPERAEFRE